MTAPTLPPPVPGGSTPGDHGALGAPLLPPPPPPGAAIPHPVDPILPPRRLPAPQPRPAASTTPLQQVVETPPAAATEPTSRPAGPPRRRRRLTLLLAVGSLVAIGGAAWWLTSGDADDPSVKPTEPTEPSVAAAPSAEPEPTGGSASIGQIGTDAISSAEEFVAELDDRTDETELLDELGLDETGVPIGSPQEAPGYRFSWTFADGSSATVIVDGATGDHEYRGLSGLTYRQLGDEGFARTEPTADWVTVDPNAFAEIERFGLDHPLRLADLLGGAVADHLSPTDDGGWTLDADAFGAADPDLRRAWLNGVGLDPEVDGPVVMRITEHPDGESVAAASFTQPTTGATVGYTLDEVLEIAPGIERPSL